MINWKSKFNSKTNQISNETKWKSKTKERKQREEGDEKLNEKHNQSTFFHSFFVCLFKWKQKETKRKSIEFDFHSILPFIPSFLSIQFNSIQFNWLKVKGKQKIKAIDNSNKQTLIFSSPTQSKSWVPDWLRRCCWLPSVGPAAISMDCLPYATTCCQQ